MEINSIYQKVRLLKQQKWRAQGRRLIIHKKLSEFQREFRRLMGTFITGAFAFTAALLWRDAIQDLLRVIEPGGETVATKIYAALIVSIVAIFAITVVSRFMKIGEDIKAV